MRTRCIRFAAVLILLAACNRTATAGFAPSDEQAVRDAHERGAVAIAANDWPGFAALFAENGAILAPNEPAVEGRDAIQAWGASLPPITAFSAQVLAVEGSGDLAYIRGTMSITLAPPGGAPPIEDRGKFITVWRKQPDGSWKTLYDIWNTDIPLPMPAATP
jgi:uncharacterized protein (TIGR02246 family)